MRERIWGRRPQICQRGGERERNLEEGGGQSNQSVVNKEEGRGMEE